jgi:GT2 family glycosyltransferase
MASPTPSQGEPPALPVSVVVPTIGRLQTLAGCLESITGCRPRAEEIVVVDQSGGQEVAELVERFAGAGAARLESSGRGIALAVNEGLRRARHDVVLVTHDDCTVQADWIGVAFDLMTARPEQIISGRVVPDGDPDHVPSVKDDPVPHDFTGQIKPGALYPANMAVSRDRLLAFGAFDERFILAAEDVDLCYRWLRAGHPLQYRPELVVHHHDWRSRDGLQRAFRSYHHGQGLFYAKHLRRGDLRMLRYLALEVLGGVPSFPARLRGRLAGGVDPRVGAWRGVTAGLLEGWRTFHET